MTEDLIPTGPPSQMEKALLAAYADEIPKQADRLDSLLMELLKVHLAIPGLFAAAVRMNLTDAPANKSFVIAAFGFWLAALAVNLWGLLPKRWKVMEDTPRLVRKWEHQSEVSIEEFYKQNAARKRRFLFLDAALFFIGTCLAMWGMF